MSFDCPRRFWLLAAPIVMGLLYAAPPQPISYVASVKPNNAADARAFSEYSAGGRLTATAVTVAALLRIAYRIQTYQLVGAPSWILSVKPKDATVNLGPK
jgi:hypothetical protein